MIAVVQFFGSWLRRSPSMRDREPARAGADNVGLREPPIMLAEGIAASSRGDDLAPRPLADRIGAQIENIRLSGDLPDAAVAAIEAALARYRVIFERFQMDLVMLGVVILGVVGFSLNTGASLLEARLLRWRDG